MSGFNVEGLVIDSFDKSTNRKVLLSEYCNFCDTIYRYTIKHMNTRWFSLEKAVYGVLQQYDHWKGTLFHKVCYWYMNIFTFLSLSLSNIDDKSPVFHHLHSAFMIRMTKIFLLVYEAIFQTFVNFNTFLQREEPLIHVIHCQMQSFLTKLVTMFIQDTRDQFIGNIFYHWTFKCIFPSSYYLHQYNYTRSALNKLTSKAFPHTWNGWGFILMQIRLNLSDR